MEKLTNDQMENLVGGSFGTCFDEAVYAGLAWDKWVDDPTARNWASWIVAQTKLFDCAMA
jgi:hypothetical protein